MPSRIGKVPVDDGVHQRVEHEARAVAQQLRLALAAGADVAEALLRPVAHRQDVVAADEDVDLAAGQLVVRPFGRRLERVQDDEQRVVVLLDLRPLVALARVLDGERMEAELRRHLVDLFLRRLEQRDPDEALGPRHVVADVGHRDVAELLPVLVGDAVDQHGRFPIRGWTARRAGVRRRRTPEAARVARAILIDCKSVVVAGASSPAALRSAVHPFVRIPARASPSAVAAFCRDARACRANCRCC